jgi:hypothetical protein
MTPDDDRIAELRRIAFGRTRSAEDEARAEAAHLELEALLAPPAAVAAPTPEPERELDSAPTREPSARPEAHSRRVCWLIPTAGALVVGLVLGAGAMVAVGRAVVPVPAPTDTFTPGSSELPPDVDPLRASLDLGPGNLAAAEAWFDGHQLPRDEFPDEMTMENLGVDPGTTRLADTGKQGGVWVARGNDGAICLLAALNAQGLGGSCTDVASFELHGVDLMSNSNLLVVWNGERMTTSTTVP